MQTISATLSAGIKQVFTIPDARFFMLLETEAALDVELFDSEGNRSEMAIGVESGFREKAEKDNVLMGRVELTSATAQDVKFGYSVRDADNRKVTSTVSVVSGEREASLKGLAFIGKATLLAVAANYAMGQLWNPAASGVKLVVDALAVSSDVAGSVGLFRHTAALATIHASQPSNKLLGGVATNAESRTEAAAALLGTQFSVRHVLADQSTPIIFYKPIVIEPGNGLIVTHKTVNSAIFADFQYTEEGV